VSYLRPSGKKGWSVHCSIGEGEEAVGAKTKRKEARTSAISHDKGGKIDKRGGGCFLAERGGKGKGHQRGNFVLLKRGEGAPAKLNFQRERGNRATFGDGD